MRHATRRSRKLYSIKIKGEIIKSNKGKTLYRVNNNFLTPEEYKTKKDIAEMYASSPYLSKKKKDKLIKRTFT